MNEWMKFKTFLRTELSEVHNRATLPSGVRHLNCKHKIVKWWTVSQSLGTSLVKSTLFHCFKYHHLTLDGSTGQWALILCPCVLPSRSLDETWLTIYQILRCTKNVKLALTLLKSINIWGTLSLQEMKYQKKKTPTLREKKREYLTWN